MDYTVCKVAVQYNTKVAMVLVGGTGAKAVLPGMVRLPTVSESLVVGFVYKTLLSVRESATGGI